jgi:hypothetical protein
VPAALGFIYLVFGLDYSSLHTISTLHTGKPGPGRRTQRLGYLPHDEDDPDPGWIVLTLIDMLLSGGCTFPHQSECIVISYHPVLSGWLMGVTLLVPNVLGMLTENIILCLAKLVL